MNLNPYGLHDFRAKQTSQFGEDGITLELVRRINPPKFFVEIGAGDGSENCTLILWDELKWRGIWVDPAIKMMPAALAGYTHKVTVENLPDLDLGLGDIGVFSLDVDGNDYHLWRAFPRKPAIVVIEFQAQRPLDVPYIMPYDPEYVWDHKSYACGASLISMVGLGKELGYTFVGTESPTPQLDSPNAFFVRNDLVSKL